MATNGIEQMARKFHLNYDLSTNYLCCTKVKELQKHCIWNIVVDAFKNKEAIEEILRNPPSSINKILTIENTSKIFNIIEKNIQIPKWPKYYVKETLLTIRLVYFEISIFFLKIEERDRSGLLENLCFNWQGTLDPRQTFLEVIKNNKLSKQEKFEFSCRYLFDEQKIKTYFYELSPEVRNWYMTSDADLEFDSDFFIYFWIWRITGNDARFRELQKIYVQENGDNNEVNINFIFYLSIKFYKEIGIQYLIETFPSCKNEFIPAIRILARNSLYIPVTNILMFLILRIDDDILELTIDNCVFFILSSLITHPRWHDIFVIYYTMLRNHIENNDYFLLLSFVVMNIWNMIEIEGPNGKYINILRYFIKLIPLYVKEMMRFEHGKNYAKLIAKLLHIEEIKSVYLLLSTSVSDDGVLDIGNNFYILVSFYTNVFVEVFRHCSVNFRNMAFKELIKSESQIIYLQNMIDIKISQSCTRNL